jgi:hypothetical protein
MANHGGKILGLDAWQVGPTSGSAVFTASHILREPDRWSPTSRRSMAPPRVAFYEAVLRTVRLSEPVELKSPGGIRLISSSSRVLCGAPSSTARPYGRPGTTRRPWRSSRGWRGYPGHPFAPAHVSPRGGVRGGLARGLTEERGMGGRGDPRVDHPVAGCRGLLPEARNQALQQKGLSEVDPDEVEAALRTLRGTVLFASIPS